MDLTSNQFGLQMINNRFHLFDEFLNIQDSKAIEEYNRFEIYSGMEIVIDKER
ncbi:hypothetical protein OCU04_006470 [Sclerotinia nivalis]|uniref:Uncharacterized protein n=1 Tax=Sclerotinia nivalis TaxID=352851 RepID=A0A9X0DLB5_9HELO|nr:hypothetical protein OCU04_006470 [Sclerotinia nivalis]